MTVYLADPELIITVDGPRWECAGCTTWHKSEQSALACCVETD